MISIWDNPIPFIYYTLPIYINLCFIMDIYIHTLPNMQQDAVDRFEKMLFDDE